MHAAVIAGRFGLALLCGVAVGACSKRKPYVPFELDAGRATATVDMGDAATPVALRLPAIRGRHLEVPMSPFSEAGLVFHAPEGRIITDIATQESAHGGTLAALARDVSGNAPDVLVVYNYDVKYAGPPTVLADGPAHVADERCVQDASVRFSGKSSIVARWQLRCPADVAPEPASLVVVVDARAQPPVRLRVVYRDPVLDLPLTVDADGADQDADGQDDARVVVRIEPRAPYAAAPAEVEYRWLARTAGLSAVPGSLEESWQKLTRTLAQRGDERSPAVFDGASLARTLIDAVCSNPPLVKVEHGGRLEPCDAKMWGEAVDSLERKATFRRADALLWAGQLAGDRVRGPDAITLEKALEKLAPERAFADARLDEGANRGGEDAGVLDGVADAGVLAASPAEAAAWAVRSVDDRCTGSLSARVETAQGRGFDVPLPMRSERRRGAGSGCTIETLAPAEYQVLRSLPHGVLVLVRGVFIAIERGETETDAGVEAPTARRFFPAEQGSKMFAARPLALATKVGLVVAHGSAVERLTLPKDADPGVQDLWPPRRCEATDVPTTLRCEHASGAVFVTIPPRAKAVKKRVK